MAKIKLAIILSFIIASFQFQADSLAEDTAELANGGWRTIESKYCTIFCHPNVDIEEVNHKIKIRFYDILLGRGRYSLKGRSVEGQLAEKFDRIFQKVEKILDMFPRKIHLTVKIYKNQAQLDDAYAQIFAHANGKQRISYYVHKYTTIYTTEQAISQAVIAHEMGHAVTDHYFLIVPPEKIKELLSHYVEIHLQD